MNLETINFEAIKIIGAVFSVIGSLILAYRVSGILAALSFVAECHEVNLKQLYPNYHGNIQFLDNSTAHIETAKKKGLLYTGFIFIILSGAMQLIGLIGTST